MRDERGATAVLVGLLMIPLLGFAAISIDVGALYWERAQLQNGADAAALAIAQECAEDDQCDAPSALAATFANANATDGASNVLTPSFPTPTTVVVTTSTKDGATGEPALTHFFAQLIGTESTTVGAAATAEWGSPSVGTTLPLAISACDFAYSRENPGVTVLIRYDTNKECKGPEGTPIPGGFGWLDRGDDRQDSCETTFDLAGSRVQAEPGNSYPGSCDAVMANLEGTTVLIPVYDGAESANGTAKWYSLAGFAAFYVTGWKFAGGSSMPTVNTDPSAPTCAGNCRGIQGYFVEWVDVDDYVGALGGPDLGVTIVRLID